MLCQPRGVNPRHVVERWRHQGERVGWGCGAAGDGEGRGVGSACQISQGTRDTGGSSGSRGGEEGGGSGGETARRHQSPTLISYGISLTRLCLRVHVLAVVEDALQVLAIQPLWSGRQGSDGSRVGEGEVGGAACPGHREQAAAGAGGRPQVLQLIPGSAADGTPAGCQCAVTCRGGAPAPVGQAPASPVT